MFDSFFFLSLSSFLFSLLIHQYLSFSLSFRCYKRPRTTKKKTVLYKNSHTHDKDQRNRICNETAHICIEYVYSTFSWSGYDVVDTDRIVIVMRMSVNT